MTELRAAGGPGTLGSGPRRRGADDAELGELAVGDEVELEIGAVAHGGSCVARHRGRVVFVRYALPGERALVAITEAKPGSFCRGEAIAILAADPRRVTPPCRHFGPGGCGGCDWQHADAGLQRELKAAVVAEQLRRLAGLEIPVTVQELPGGGLGWRSRVRWAVAAEQGGAAFRDVANGDAGAAPSDVAALSHTAPGGAASRAAASSGRSASGRAASGRSASGRAASGRSASGRSASGRSASGRAVPAGEGPVAHIGPRRFRSHEVVPISVQQPCLIAAAGLSEAAEALATGLLRGADELVLIARPGNDPLAVPLRRGRPAGPTVTTAQVAGRFFAVDAAGFWQAHEQAATVLCEIVAGLLADLPVTGGVAWDLYGGVGLFAPVLAAAVGESGAVTTVEADRPASAHAAANLADLAQVTAVCARVDRFLAETGDAVDVVLLDPPRSGAGRAICTMIAERRPAAIIYVACDPAALARDTAELARAGYRLEQLRAVDAFPQTHHVECLARFLPAD